MIFTRKKRELLNLKKNQKEMYQFIKRGEKNQEETYVNHMKNYVRKVCKEQESLCFST